MACLLNAEDVLQIYGDIYENILSNIKSNTKFNPDIYIKNIYDEIAKVNDSKFALEVAQAVPQIMLQVIATRPNVAEYFYTNNIKSDPIIGLSVKFKNIDEVNKFIVSEPITLDDAKETIKKSTRKKNQVEINNPTEGMIMSDVQSKARTDDPLSNSGQFAIPGNPKELSESEKDKVDPEKVMFYKVIKNIIDSFSNRLQGSEDVIYKGVAIAQRAVLEKNFPKKENGTSYLTQYDLQFLEANPEYNGIANVITDTDGNFLYFDENGEFTTPENGRLVYQAVRDVKLVNNKLQLVNRSGFPYTLVSPEEIVEKEEKRIKQLNPIGMLLSEKLRKIEEIKQQQKKKINDLMRLRKYVVENPDAVVVTKITGGSFGSFKRKFVPISETGLTVENLSLPFTAGEKSGYLKVKVLSNTEKNTEEQEVYLQRGDMTEELADKIAMVLTTDALYRGEPLSPQARKTYAEVFLEEDLPKNRITINTPEVNGITTLQVRLDGNLISLEDENARQLIKEHLLNAVKIKDGTLYPANVNYNDDYIGGDFVDYVIENGKLKTKNVNYFNFIKPFIKIEFSSESGAVFVNSNAYLTYSVPTEVLPVSKKSYDLASVNSTSTKTKSQEPTVVKGDQEVVSIEPGEIVFSTKTVSAPYQITKNIEEAGVTLNIASDFTKGEAESVKKKAKKEKGAYIPLTLSKKSKTAKTFPNAKAIADNIVSNLNITKSDTINVTGANIAELGRAGWSQTDINGFMSKVFEEIVNSPKLIQPVTKVLSTGETGASEAVIKAAKKNGIGVEVTVPKGYAFTMAWAKGKTGVWKVSDKAEYLKRFGITTEKTTTKSKNRTAAAKEKTDTKAKKATNKKGKTTTPKTTEQAKAIDENLLNAQRNMFAMMKQFTQAKNRPAETDKLNRLENAERKLGGFFERLFTTKAQREAIYEWWDNSPLSQAEKTKNEKFIRLERVTEAINSDAFGYWTQHGITLHLGDKATPIDLWHEAWHGFTQLFLTPEEKTDLYNKLRVIPKFKDASFYDIEEALAEDYRNYLVDQTLYTGFLGKLFKKVRDFLRSMFGKITRQDMSRPRDIADIKEMYDKLYKGEILEYRPSIQNIEWSKLNRSKTIDVVKSREEFDAPFSIEETEKVLTLFDNLIGSEIDYYNSSNDSKSGVIRVFSDPEERLKLFETVKEDISNLASLYIEKANTMTTDNLAEAEKIKNQISLLVRASNNFGNIQSALTGKASSGLIGFAIKNSRFQLFQEELEEDPTDLENSRILEDYKGNVINPKKLASPTTTMFISNIQQIQKNEDGTTEQVLDYFGIPQLEDSDIIWNKLSRVLAGSFDYLEMYKRLQENAENYPEFYQVLNSLRDPADFNSKDSAQWKLETNFWQDFKKPRIPFKQYNIIKDITQTEYRDDEGNIVRPEIAKFDSVVTSATPAIASVLNDWSSNFSTASLEINPYIILDVDGNPSLDTEKMIQVPTAFSQLGFANKNGTFNDKKSREFLEAMGIYLDRTSSEINAIFKDTSSIARAFQLDLVFENIKKVNRAALTTDLNKVSAANAFKSDPLKYLLEGLPKALRENQKQTGDISSKIKMLAEMQNYYSDGYSNFSVISPEGNRLWEQMVDNTITRIVTSINEANNWFELTDPKADPNNRFQHMRWLSDNNNPYPKYSKILNTVFYLDDVLAPEYGQKRKVTVGTEERDVVIDLNNVGGTQLIIKNANDSVGASTASLDATSKFLQEIHTLLLGGVEEFMRHASKNTAMSLTAKNINTYGGKQDKHLYVDITAFKPSNNGLGETEGFEIILGYIAGELERVNRYNNNPDYQNYEGYNREVVDDNGNIVDAGSIFTAFDDVLSKEVKEELYNLNTNLMDAVDSDPSLRKRIKDDVLNYFENQTKANLKRLQASRFIDESLYQKGEQAGMSQSQVDETLMKAYTYNSWIHKFETLILAYGDLAQYNHSKEEFHKRNAGLGSGGKGFRTDLQAMMHINSLSTPYATKNGYTVRPYDGTLTTAIIKEKEIKESVYYKEYLEKLTKAIESRIGNKTKAKEMAEKALSEYLGMKEGDGQGHINLEAYRKLKNLEGSWTDQQELLYLKIANGESISAEEVIEFFPPYKLQYFGPINTTGLVVNSFHKFSLAPLIPFTTDANSHYEKLNAKMMDKKIDYVVFQTGSKVGHVGKGDIAINEDGSFNDGLEFTENKIFVEYLKNQTEINSKYKAKSVFSTQLRKLILEGLYEKGVIDTTDQDKITNPRVRKYLKDVEEYSETLKVELLNEIGFEKQGDQYVPKSNESLEKLAELIRNNLERDDVFGDHLIEFVDVLEDGTLQYDLSLHPEAAKIEKLIMSIINKRLIKQQFHGEPLVQVASSFYSNAFKVPENKLRKGNKEDEKKWIGSNILPSYHEKADGFTAAMKVMIALQGDYNHLLNLEYKGEPIGTIDRLNEAIKDDEWLDADNGANRKAITMVGVRIPVQGLNSMEFMEIYHFLPPQAGNIIIPPSEIVAKSGADFDIDKLTIYMNNINADGTLPEKMFNDEEGYSATEQLKDYLNDPEISDEEKELALYLQKSYLQNSVINSMKEILELPQNYTSLITPNGTFLVKEIADDLAKYVMEYDPFAVNYGKTRVDKKGKRIISPTRVLETLYNIYKHESNVVGKRTLGLGAVENTFHTLINSVETPGGAAMPSEFFHGREENPREALLWLRHNTTTKNNKELISIAGRYDVEGVNKIADIISQLMNGWVDVEKDAWVFFVQGNYEVAPMLLYLLKTGVPVKEAIYFVSQPLVREYVKEQRDAKSTFADVLNKKPEHRNFIKFQAASEVLRKNLPSEVFAKLKNNRSRYEFGKQLAEDILSKRQNPNFTENEMYKLITDFKKTPSIGQSELSIAMFLHYLQIEQQTTGLTRLKMAMNPDTSTKTTGSDAEQAEANIEGLVGESKIEEGLLPSLQNDSIISSFFNNSLALTINELIFPLRYNKAISSFLIGVNQRLREDSEKLFGENNTDKFLNTFRNDVVSFIFQQASRKYKLTDIYKSYSLKTSVPVALVDELKFGAFVKKDKSGNKTLYIDAKSIKDDFNRGVWIKGSKEKDSFESRGLFPLREAHFHSDKNTNEDEYLKFVAEREYLRSIYPKSEVFKTEKFKTELEATKQEFADYSETKAKNYTYEKLLAYRALENTLNPYHMFNDPKEAYAIQFNRLMLKYGAELKDKYTVLKKMKSDPNSDRTMFNLYVAEKDFTTSSSNLYYKNLKDLGDPAIQKVSDPEANQEISDFFARMPLYTFMQTGINKTKFNFNNIVDFQQFMYLVENESKNLIKALESNNTANAFLETFYKRFLRENGKQNPNRGRYKNYLFDFDIQTLRDMTKAELNPEDEENLDTRYKILSTKTENVFVYDDSDARDYGAYKRILDSNSDITFAYGAPVSHLQNKKTQNFSKQEFIRNIGREMSVGFPIALNEYIDNLANINPENFGVIKNSYDNAIERLVDLKNAGKQIAFPIEGIGNGSRMPQELFVYLSKRLYQEFGYINPGSSMYKEIGELIGKNQGLSDIEILAELGLEEDPFACKI
jgi:hypothetical protein